MKQIPNQTLHSTRTSRVSELDVDLFQPKASMQQTRPDFCIIDPSMGNLRSVCRAWEHCGACVRLAPSADEIGQPDALVFPGQGSMAKLIEALSERNLTSAIRDWIAADRPFFGICLGLQALFEHSEEGDAAGLGIFPGQLKRFRPAGGEKVPHMGWNTAEFRSHPPPGITANNDAFYFVHSYFLPVEAVDKDLVWCTTRYAGATFVSGIHRGNCFATQFHPEKSQAKGLQIYSNFVALTRHRIPQVPTAL